jgi:hypothetical protein
MHCNFSPEEDLLFSGFGSEVPFRISVWESTAILASAKTFSSLVVDVAAP